MSNTFNINRFGKYMAYDLKSRWKDQWLFLVVFAILPMIFHLIFLFFAALGQDGFAAFISGTPITRPPLVLRIIMFFVVAGLFFILFPSRAYGFLTEKAPGTDWIGIPASRLEKFLSMMLTCLVIVPGLFFVVYLLSDSIVCLVDKHCETSLFKAWLDFDLVKDGAPFKLGAKGLWFLINWTLQTVSVFLLGALIFKKGKIAKTILTLFLISMVSSMITAAIASSIDPDSMMTFIETWAENHLDKLDLWFNLLTNASLVLVVGGLGLWSWFKVKNLQH